MKIRANLFTAVCASLLLAITSIAQAQDEAPAQTLFTNVNVFDGYAEELAMGMNVLVEGNLIKQVSAEPISAASATVIDGGGRTLMPGMIENHAHLMLMGPTLPAMEGMTTWEDFAIHGTKMAEMYLLQGFTTLRDAGHRTATLSVGSFPGWARRSCGLRQLRLADGRSYQLLASEHGTGGRRRR
jgi:hypothetical protein